MTQVLPGLDAMRRVGSTNGGEYHGPCPQCDGTDRYVVHPAHPRKGFVTWCRRCRRGGGLASYLEGLNFPADEARRLIAAMPTKPTTPTERATPGPPSWEWHKRARDFIAECVEALASDAGARARTYLRERRGLDDATVGAARLGLNVRDRYEAATRWGFPDDRAVWLPRGVVIPNVILAREWALNIRRPAGDPKYLTARGSIRAPYMRAPGRPGDGRPVVLLEGEFDALLLARIAGDIVRPVALPASSGKAWAKNIAALSTPAFLLAHDADDAGERASMWWLARLPRGPRRWRPYEAKDVSDMWLAGGDGLVRRWVEAGATQKGTTWQP